MVDLILLFSQKNLKWKKSLENFWKWKKIELKNGSFLTHFNKSKSLNNNPSFVSVNRHKKSYIMFMHALPGKRKNGGKTDSFPIIIGMVSNETNEDVRMYT